MTDMDAMNIDSALWTVDAEAMADAPPPAMKTPMEYMSMQRPVWVTGGVYRFFLRNGHVLRVTSFKTSERPGWCHLAGVQIVHPSMASDLLLMDINLDDVCASSVTKFGTAVWAKETD